MVKKVKGQREKVSHEFIFTRDDHTCRLNGPAQLSSPDNGHWYLGAFRSKQDAVYQSLGIEVVKV